MSINKLGFKNVGSKDDKRIILLLQATPPVGAPIGTVQVPGVGSVLGWMDTIDPLAFNTPDTFGPLKALQATFTILNQLVDSANTNNFTPGRVWFYIVSSGQLFLIAPRTLVDAQIVNGGGRGGTFIVPIECVTSSQVQIFYEANMQNGSPIAPPDSGNSVTLSLQLMNFDVPPINLN